MVVKSLKRVVGIEILMNSRALRNFSFGAASPILSSRSLILDDPLKMLK